MCATKHPLNNNAIILNHLNLLLKPRECLNSGMDFWNNEMEIFESSVSKIRHKSL